MTLEEFIAKNPERKEIARQICAVANNDVHGVDVTDTHVWEKLSELGGFTANDFFDDQEATLRRFNNDMEAITHHGVRTWKLKEGVL